MPRFASLDAHKMRIFISRPPMAPHAYSCGAAAAFTRRLAALSVAEVLLRRPQLRRYSCTHSIRLHRLLLRLVRVYGMRPVPLVLRLWNCGLRAPAAGRGSSIST